MPSNPQNWSNQATVSTNWSNQATNATYFTDQPLNPPTGSLLLQDGVSHILQQDALSKLLIQ